MPKLVTLRRQREIDALFRGGRRLRGRLLMAVVLPRPEEGPRALFVVGRKVGGAVVRNRVRRRLREAYRAAVGRFQRPIDVALVAHPPAAEATYQQLAAELAELLAKAGVCPRDPGG